MQMQPFEVLMEKWLAPVAIFSSAFVFALAPFVLLMNKDAYMDRRTAIRYTIQTIWLMFANILVGLVSYPWTTSQFGRYLGVVVTVVLTMFGGTIAFGIYQYVFNHKLKIGEALVKTQINVKDEDNHDN